MVFFQKLSIVTPIFKGGDKTLVSNYRSISKQNIMPKLFENIITIKLSSLFKNILIDEQHGFVAGCSVSTNLFLYLYDFINIPLSRKSLKLMRYTLISVRHSTVLITPCWFVNCVRLTLAEPYWIGYRALSRIDHISLSLIVVFQKFLRLHRAYPKDRTLVCCYLTYL